MKTRKILLKLQAIFMYIAIIPFVALYFVMLFASPEYGVIYVFLGLIILGLVLYGLTMPLAIANSILGFIGFIKNSESPLKETMKIKLICILWFIGNFYAAILTSAPLLNPFLMMAVPFIWAIFGFFGYSFGVSVNVYDFTYIIHEIKEKRLKKSGLLIFLIILLIIPVLDVLVSIILYKITPRYKIEEVKEEKMNS